MVRLFTKTGKQKQRFFGKFLILGATFGSWLSPFSPDKSISHLNGLMLRRQFLRAWSLEVSRKKHLGD